MAGPKTDSTGQIQRPPAANGGGGKQPDTLERFLQSMLPEITRAMPKHMSPERMARIMLTALRVVPKLSLCTMPSFAGCIMQLAQLGLEPNTPLGHAYLVPRRNGKASTAARREIIECTLVPGYKGFIELGRRAGVSIKAEIVYEGDRFERSYGLEPTLVHVPQEDDGRIMKRKRYVYAVARGKDLSEPVFEVLDRAQVEFRRGRSSDPNLTIWKSDEDAMWRKSAVRALVTWAPMSVEISTAAAIDNHGTASAQAAAFDPMVAEMLQKQGIEAPEDDDEQGAPALTSGDERLDELQQVIGGTEREHASARRERQPGEEG